MESASDVKNYYYGETVQYIHGVPGGKVNILGGHSIGHSKQKSVYVHMSYSERFPRYNYFTVQYTIQTSNTPCPPQRSCNVH
jgi:hypothetical protein